MVSYSDLISRNGKKCFTLTRNYPAIMEVDDIGVKIIYPTERTLFIPRTMVEDAIRWLNKNGELKMEVVHENITEGDGPRTDRLLAVLRELPGVMFTSVPRSLRLK